jgi:hypothetical protein
MKRGISYFQWSSQRKRHYEGLTFEKWHKGDEGGGQATIWGKIVAGRAFRKCEVLF